MSWFVVDNGSKSCVDQNFWVTTLPDELLVGIFGELEPEDLIRSSEVCLHWYKTSLSSHFYLNFAQRVKYFCCINGPADFTVDPKSLFIQHYSALQALPRSGQTRYQALRHLLSPDGLTDLKKIWDSLLPSIVDLRSNSLAILAAFPYQEHVAKLRACVSAGAFTIENPLENRVFCLSCFHGDIETASMVWGNIQLKIPPEKKNRVLQYGIIFAVEGKQPDIVRYLNSEGTVSVRNTILGNFNHADFESEGPYAAMAEFLIDGLGL